MDQFSFLSNGDVAAFEALYQQYKSEPSSVDPQWKQFFEGFEFARANFEEAGEMPENYQKEFKVLALIDGYRKSGHLFTRTNPVRERRQYSPTLDHKNFGLEDADLQTVFQAGTQIGIGPATLQQIIDHLTQTYCQSIGAEFTYVRYPGRVDWLKERMEGTRNQPNFDNETKRQILHKLNQATVFESFLHTKFVGQKRFSLEGAESLIPALDTVIEVGADMGVKEYVMGMAHRGRLNVLANILNKTYDEIFKEFEGVEYEDALFDGDVKYHLGFTSTQKSDNGHDIEICLAPNPSHLEAVDPVVQGITRSKLDHKYDGDTNKIVPILMHGDAALAAQGVVYEVVQMARLEGYSVGGTIHIAINNQIGFTTNYLDARSSTYCTDIGKVTLCPVFHVNGDDVEAVVLTMKTALEYRMKFGRDVFVDLLCYRKYGHNEGDEPRFTQPLLYKIISKHPNPREIYYQKLVAAGEVEEQIAKEMKQEFNDMLNNRLDMAKQSSKAEITNFLSADWTHVGRGPKHGVSPTVNTAVKKKDLLEIGKKITELPKDLKFFKKIEKIHRDRAKMIEDDALDWGMAELLAYGTLLSEGHDIRFSGQDVERGTFSHRHAVLKVEESEEEYVPLNNLSDKQGHFDIYNSLLSEYAVLGFEYGYALASPNDLVIWEAQFGDFNNGAQIIIDQFLVCGEDKWNVHNGLVMLLPHGYEGQGAEHSSARMERYLSLCAQNNITAVNCTTPANFFHVLRRQLKQDYRRPLVVFTPKKLLRYPKCVSSLKEMTDGQFREVITDVVAKPADVRTLMFCSGKVYYDLLEEQERIGADDVAIVRLEQLYPLPKEQVLAEIEKFNKAERICWVQEEPANMGAWLHILGRFGEVKWELVSRNASPAPATGSIKTHEKRFRTLMDEAFASSKVHQNVTA